jgi:hypothetical protein
MHESSGRGRTEELYISILSPVSKRKLFMISTQSLRYNFDDYFLLKYMYKIKTYILINILYYKSIHIFYIFIK